MARRGEGGFQESNCWELGRSYMSWECAEQRLEENSNENAAISLLEVSWAGRGVGEKW